MPSSILSHDGSGQTIPAPDLIKDSDTENFMADVIEASKQVPVIVDFWAPWCGPCKQLTPMLEKAVKVANGKVRLVKINIDDNQEIASQMRVQSIPAVFGFKDTRPVDGFMGNVTESQVKQFIEKLVGEPIENPAETLVEAARSALEAGDINTAGQTFAQALQHDRESSDAIAGLAKCQIEADDLDGARATLTLTPPTKENDPEIISAKAALDLAETSPESVDTAQLEAKLAKTPGDHETRLELALALNSAGLREQALDHIFIIVKQDLEWNNQAARQQLLKFFEAWGPADEFTVSGRRRLSSILFS